MAERVVSRRAQVLAFLGGAALALAGWVLVVDHQLKRADHTHGFGEHRGLV